MERLDKVNCKLFSLSAQFSKANLKLSVDLAYRNSENKRDPALSKYSYVSKRYSPSLSVDSLTMFPNWSLMLECKSTAESLKQYNKEIINITSEQVYSLYNFIKRLRDGMQDHDDIFYFDDGKQELVLSTKYSQLRITENFGSEFYCTNIAAELSVYFKDDHSKGEPSYLITLNGDYNVFFNMRLQELNNTLFLLERTDFICMAINIMTTIGIPEEIPTMTSNSSRLLAEEEEYHNGPDTISRGEKINMVQKLTDIKKQKEMSTKDLF